MEDDDHTHLDLLVRVTQEQHKIYLDMLDRVANGCYKLCLVLEVFLGLNLTHCTQHVNGGHMIKIHYLLDPDILGWSGVEGFLSLRYYLRVLIEGNLKLTLLILRRFFDFSLREEVTSTQLQHISHVLQLRCKIHAF